MKKIIVVFLIICTLFFSGFVGGCFGTGVNSSSSQSSVETETFEYTTKYYFEAENGKFSVDNEKTVVLTAENGATVSADIKTFQGYVYDETNLLNVISGVIEDDTLVLKVYYKLDAENPGTPETPGSSDEPEKVVEVTITFDTSNIEGLTFESITVNAGETITPPETNTYYQDLLIWKDENGAIFDFSQPITEDITLIATEIQFIG